ncbi:pkb-activating kinase-like protein [Dinochytrium kinnereticum]|nr:pkb-activating kinase-like protein [Dinochytrium kinnereticum]
MASDALKAVAAAAASPDAATDSPSTPGGTPESVRKRGPKDFEFGREIGSGSYSTVYFAKEKGSDREFAVKILDKKHVIKEKKVKYVQIEKEILHRMSHPLIIKLFYTFQTNNSLYFVLEFASKGDLQGILRKTGKMEQKVARFYIAEVIAGVEHLHKNNIIHRDLKPENILISANNHIKITDFGSAKILSTPDTASSEADKKNSFVGTAEYCSPELLNDRAASFKSDVWALGCILFQMLSGKPPFRGGNEYQTFQKIMKLDFEFPENFPGEAIRLVNLILKLEPEARPTLAALKEDAFFSGLVWEELDEQEPPVDFQNPTLDSTDGSLEDLLAMGSQLGLTDKPEPTYPFEKDESLEKGGVSLDSITSTNDISLPSTPKMAPTSVTRAPDLAGERQRALQSQRISRLGTLVDSHEELIVLVGSVILKKVALKSS